VGKKLSSNFKEATVVETATIDPSTLKSHQLIVRNHVVGINASDVNFTAGRYKPGLSPPFDCGFEAISEVVAVGKEVSGFNKGDAVGVTSAGAFAEYQVISSRSCFRLPSLSAKYLPLFVSGLTASIGLEKVGEIQAGETVLVTAAAGGTGTFAVQLAKKAGCHVIGTVSSDTKSEYLKQLGCDRIINTSQEDLKKVLKSEYPKGIDVIYESVGGEIFDACITNIAVKGRLIIIGFISGYSDQSGWKKSPTNDITNSGGGGVPLHARLLAKSASLRGFFLNDYPEELAPHLSKLMEWVDSGKIQPSLDPSCVAGAFVGVSSIPDAVEFIYSRKNIGKVFVHLTPPSPTKSKL